MATNTYIALTIGPIYKTISNARATRELWGASYLFSYITEKVVQYLISNGIPKNNLVMPYAGKKDAKKLHFGAGIFPDRVIFLKTNQDDRATMEAAADFALNKVCQIVKKTLESQKLISENANVEEYIKTYLQTYIVEKELKSGDNAILEITPYLDTIELQSQIMPVEPEIPRPIKVGKAKTKKDKIERRSYLEMYLEYINGSHLKKKVFDDNEENRGIYQHISGFPSLPDIATIALYEQFKFPPPQTNDNDEEYYEALNNMEGVKQALQKHHKYICIVHADGDNVGKTIANIKNNQFLPFSEKLYNFGFQAAKLINEYGGKPVYIGGDDLLFFAPVISNKGNIFSLIDSISKKFDELGFEVAQNEKKPTLSFGISVSYYKFPMFEALEISRNLLFDTAKKHETKSKKEKNAVAFRFLKHSGQYWQTSLQKETALYHQFIELLTTFTISDATLSSLTYALNQTKPLLNEVWARHPKQSAARSNPFLHFFDNFFNEEIHQGDTKDYIAKLAHLLWLSYQNTEKPDEATPTLYALLRTLNFLSPQNK